MQETRTDALVIGGSQAGIAVGYGLRQAGIDFVIVDAAEHVGDAWRSRWDSLQLFTAAKFNDLPGMPFPGDRDRIPGKDEMADYLVAMVERFNLPVETGVRIERLTREGDQYVATAPGRRILAPHVVLATGPTGTPVTPPIAGELGAGITQLHAAQYKRPDQLPEGPTVVAGAGNSGAEIAIELADTGREVTLAGRDVGKLPVKLAGVPYRVMNKYVTRETKWGQKLAEDNSGKGTPLVRITPEDVTEAGVRRVGKIASVDSGRPVPEDGEPLDVHGVVWATGYRRDYSWVDVNAFDERGEPRHHRGVVQSEPGLYVIAIPFLYSVASSLIMGLKRDATHIAETIAARSSQGAQQAQGA